MKIPKILIVASMVALLSAGCSHRGKCRNSLFGFRPCSRVLADSQLNSRSEDGCCDCYACRKKATDAQLVIDNPDDQLLNTSLEIDEALSSQDMEFNLVQPLSPAEDQFSVLSNSQSSRKINAWPISTQTDPRRLLDNAEEPIFIIENDSKQSMVEAGRSQPVEPDITLETADEDSAIVLDAMETEVASMMEQETMTDQRSTDRVVPSHVSVPANVPHLARLEVEGTVAPLSEAPLVLHARKNHRDGFLESVTRGAGDSNRAITSHEQQFPMEPINFRPLPGLKPGLKPIGSGPLVVTGTIAAPPTDVATRMLQRHATSTLIIAPSKVLRLRATTNPNAQVALAPVVNLTTDPGKFRSFDQPMIPDFSPYHVDHMNIDHMVNDSQISESIRRLTVRPELNEQSEPNTLDR